MRHLVTHKFPKFHLFFPPPQLWASLHNEKLRVMCLPTGWTMVFKLVAGVSADISRLWSSDDPLNENNAEVLNTTSTPKEHYKNRMIRNWNTLGLKEVRKFLKIFRGHYDM